MQSEVKLGRVISVDRGMIRVRVDSLKDYEENKRQLSVGGIVKIGSGNNDFIIAIVSGFKSESVGDEVEFMFTLECAPIGMLDDEGAFTKGVSSFPVPLEDVYLFSDDGLLSVWNSDSKYDFEIGEFSGRSGVSVKVDGDGFWGKHIAVVGSTGSGKSCVVSRMLQNVLGVSEGGICRSYINNVHVVLFDLHSEYSRAFNIDSGGCYTLNAIDVENMKLPYWLLNSEELESLFIESNESNSHNQVSQFRRAVIRNKELHNTKLQNITYDTPVYFSLMEVFNFITNLNAEVVFKGKGRNGPKKANGDYIESQDEYFYSVIEFVPSASSGEQKATKGAFAGEFDRFIARLENKMGDRRLKFIMDSSLEGDDLSTKDFPSIIQRLIGYVDKSNVTIVDLSGVPSEVLNICVSLFSRMIFDFCFHYTKKVGKGASGRELPVLLVCEEAHNYIPNSGLAIYRDSLKSIERIAKEGRKYGVSLMVVSQRPSDISHTVLSQCNNFVALKLTNSNDQNYVLKLLPDNSSYVCDRIQSLSVGEGVVVGESVLLPSVVKFEMPNPAPSSESLAVRTCWERAWLDVDFMEIVKRWHRDE